MRAQMIEQHRTADRTWSPWSPRVVAYLGAVTFLVAAVWYGLAANNVTVAGPPPAGGTEQESLHAYYRWVTTTLPQERLYTSLAIIGFLCLSWTAMTARDWLGRDRIPARIGAGLAGAGAVLWIGGDVLELGGHRAVGLMATHANPVQTVSSIAFTVDAITEAIELAALLMVGAGLLALAAAAAADRAWRAGTVVVGLTLLATGASYAAGNATFSEWALIISGAVAVPAWLAWTGRAGS